MILKLLDLSFQQLFRFRGTKNVMILKLLELEAYI